MEEVLSKNFIASEIIGQLELILKSKFFTHSGTLSSFLNFITRETIEGRQNSLKEYVIALNVLSKPADFNPQVDPVVRVNAGRLRRALADYYQEDGKEDTILIFVPKGSYIPVFSRRTDILRPNRPETDALFIKPVIAVLPFRNINPHSPHIFFADGLSDHISTELTRYTELSVISYYSCRSIVSKVTDLTEVARLLKADFILTGSVQSDTGQLRTGISLVSCKTNAQIWAKSIDRIFTSEDLLEIEDEIARIVISQVAGHFGVIFRNLIRATRKINKDSKIHDAIFWYYHFVTETNEEIFILAEDALHHAVHSDPEYALGWAVLGELKTAAYFMGFKSSRTKNLLEEAIYLGRKSLKLDPHCQHGFQTLALANLFLHNKEEVIKTADNWLLLQHNASGVKGGIGFCLICSGEYERGFSLLNESISLNPYYPWWHNAGISFYHLHHANYYEALIWGKKINMPHIPWEFIIAAVCNFYLGEMLLAQQNADHIRKHFPFVLQQPELYLSAFINDFNLVDQLKNAMGSLGFRFDPHT